MIATALIHLGFEPLLDFEVWQSGDQITLRWLSTKPRPTDAEIAAAALPAAQAAKRTAIKQAARQVILGRYPEWMQANLTARAVELVSLGELTGPDWGKMQTIWSWITSVRAHSNLLEADVDACTTVEAVEAMSIEAGWPE